MKLKIVVTLTILIQAVFTATAQDIDTLVNVGKQKMHFNVWKGNGIPILF